MSVARVTTVTKSMKAATCEKCRIELPKGSAYRHFKVGFRSRYVHKRCMKPECTPRASELESSLLSGVYAAQEDAGDTLDAGGFESADDIKQVLSSCAEGIREVASQYAESAEAMGDAGSEMQERADTLESSADDLENTDVEEQTADCDACEGTGQEECQACSATGKDETGDPDEDGEYPDCTECDGEGKVDCDVEGCDEGQVPDLDAMVEAAREAVDGVELP